MTQTERTSRSLRRAAASAQPAPERTRRAARVGRRGALLTLGGLGGAGLAILLVGPVGRLAAERDRPFPDWAYTSPRSGEAYAAAFSDLDLMAMLPCFCGCMRSAQPHVSLKDCFVQASGEIEPHAAFCQTCQDEAIDAVALVGAGVEQREIHRRIVAAYGDGDPAFSGPAGGGQHSESTSPFGSPAGDRPAGHS